MRACSGTGNLMKSAMWRAVCMHRPKRYGHTWRIIRRSRIFCASTCTTWAIPLAVWRAISSWPMSIPCIRAGLSGIILTRPFTGRMWMERRSWDMAGTLGTDPRITPFAATGLFLLTEGKSPPCRKYATGTAQKRSGSGLTWRAGRPVLGPELTEGRVSVRRQALTEGRGPVKGP